MIDFDADLRRYIAERDRLNGIIAAMMGDATGATGMPFIPVNSDKYKGDRAIQAAARYMKEFPRSTRFRLSQIVEALVKGNADPGEPRGEQRDPAQLISHTLRIGLPTKRRIPIFEVEPTVPSPKGTPNVRVIPDDVPNEKVTVWLAPTADLPNRRKRTPSPPRKKYYHKPYRRKRGPQVQNADSPESAHSGSSEHPDIA